MVSANSSATLEKKTPCYQPSRDSIYSLQYFHQVWISHEDVWVTDEFKFVLPNKQRIYDGKTVTLLDADFALLEEYNRRMVRHHIPLDQIKSRNLNLVPVNKVDFKTLEILCSEGIVFARQ